MSRLDYPPTPLINNNNNRDHDDNNMTRKSQTPALEAETERLRAKVDSIAEEMAETKAVNDKLHVTIKDLSQRLNDQARVGKAENAKLQATIDKLILVTQSLSEPAMANNDKNEQFQLFIEKVNEQHDITRQRNETISTHIREDLDHLYDLVTDFRIEGADLNCRIETMTSGFTADDGSIDVLHERIDTLKDNHE